MVHLNIGLLLSLSTALAFQGHTRVALYNTRCHNQPSILFASEDKDTSDGEDHKSDLDELTPPSVSFSRNSMLFGDNPPSQLSNGPLKLWRGTKSILPPLVTGAWDDDTRGDKKPVEHLYNLAFVRAPTVLMGIVYIRNIILGHGLMMNVGDGFFEVPPVLVFAVIAVILR